MSIHVFRASLREEQTPLFDALRRLCAMDPSSLASIDEEPWPVWDPQ